MANGDIAAAAGIPIVPPTALVKMGYDEINLTRDTIVTFTKPTVDKVAAATPTASGHALVKWDANGRLQAMGPAISDDVATKGYVDTAAVPWSAVAPPSSAVANAIPRYSGTGTLQAADPANATDVTNVRWVQANALLRSQLLPVIDDLLARVQALEDKEN